MRHRSPGIAVPGLLCALLAGCAASPPQPPQSALDWHRLEHAGAGPSSSPVTAFVHRNGVVPASADAPAALRGLPGYWQGWINRDRAGSVAVAITSLDSREATGQYAFASMQTINGNADRNRQFAMRCAVMADTYLACDLTRAYTTGARLYLRPREDGALMVRFTNDGRSFASGILSRS